MTPQQIEAMKLALEALKKCHYYMIDAGLPNQSLLNEAFTAYKAIKEALAQPEQEPVANYCKECLTYNGHHEGCSHYTHPPQRKPLTHEQRFDVLTKFEPHKHEWHAPAILIDLVEAAHGIKE